MKRLFAAAFALLLSSSLGAAVEQDLGNGLFYVRIADLGKDASALELGLGKEAAVIDLRYAAGTADAAARLAKKLESVPTGAKPLRIILITPSTAVPIVEAVAIPRRDQLTLGPRTPALKPDIAVATTVEEDRHAYEALSTSTPLDKLVNGNLEKRRFDEAALARRNSSGAGSDDLDNDDDGPERTASEKTANHPPYDAVLGRAIQIHRALLVMKRG